MPTIRSDKAKDRYQGVKGADKLGRRDGEGEARFLRYISPPLKHVLVGHHHARRHAGDPPVTGSPSVIVCPRRTAAELEPKAATSKSKSNSKAESDQIEDLRPSFFLIAVAVSLKCASRPCLGVLPFLIHASVSFVPDVGVRAQASEFSVVLPLPIQLMAFLALVCVIIAPSRPSTASSITMGAYRKHVHIAPGCRAARPFSSSLHFTCEPSWEWLTAVLAHSCIHRAARIILPVLPQFPPSYFLCFLTQFILRYSLAPHTGLFSARERAPAREARSFSRDPGLPLFTVAFFLHTGAPPLRIFS
ncbi:hypothetical protein B0H17DRAFT_1147630 [Mycena rosella]|uniref:Uncharacterized protein n=1 Tax=Mycena rosella TaxID=1033263 RepID=A0AAD7FZL8_MYCRO|nr:hypothetical protein B0H17DRAFT_1147630 [Mycena rosella]